MHSELEVEWVAIGDLFGNPANPRHNEDAVGSVADSIRRFGWQQPVVAKPSGEVIAGNTRLKAAQRLGLERVPVVRFHGFRRRPSRAADQARTDLAAISPR